ncbi:class I SAM-dependent methyltransferase [Ruania halotolerans]|uniref:class I SAM-dependent methyltransferase n=1 Tax=Ruania halotolerans TaxID=2897773 RepID=UPI001E49D7F6|nr:class I SAM-dependent methyltransferase [Ruania halotolerans]UFU06945.1 class I SAM-dependent methyltransferase [Ruania halotolerans]
MSLPTDPIVETTTSTVEAYAANRANWDDRATVHVGSAAYDVDGFVADPGRISSVIHADMAILAPHLEGERASAERPLRGLNVCHLQCHIGTDTLSMARLGGRVTGVDLSPGSLAIARDLATRCAIDARWVESEVTEAASAVGETFDHVHTSIGTICWVQDLDAWARAIAALLRPGGTFFFRDQHPALAAMDDMVTDDVRLGNRYWPLPPGRAFTYSGGITYTDGDHSTITATRNYEWPHPVSQILQALLDAGLSLVAVGEHESLPWQALPVMVPGEGSDADGYVLPAPWREQLPVALSVVARKPA